MSAARCSAAHMMVAYTGGYDEAQGNGVKDVRGEKKNTLAPAGTGIMWIFSSISCRHSTVKKHRI